MSALRLMGCATAATIASLITFGSASAAMAPVVQNDAPDVSSLIALWECNLGPAGVCVIGTDEPRHDTVIERRSVDEGCRTKSVTRENGMGDTETRTKTNYD